MPAIVRPVEVNTAGVFFLVWHFVQPGAELKLKAGFRIHPDLALVYVTDNIWFESFPPFDLACRSRQAAITVFRAAFTALIALFHDDSGRDFALRINHLPMARAISWCAGEVYPELCGGYINHRSHPECRAKQNTHSNICTGHEYA